MRKLLAGYLFRMIKSPVMWALLACGLIASVCFMYTNFAEINTVTVLHTNRHFYLGDYNQAYVDASNAKEYRFESLGISALDVERNNIVPIDQNSYDLLKGINTANRESRIFNGSILTLHYAPAIVIALIIPIFWGRLFSDGTMKNLVACGYSRKKIYLSALIYSFILDSVLILFNIFVFICFCIYYEWKPPVYLPSAFTTLIVEVLIVFNVSAVVVSALFASARKTVTFVAGFLMLAFIFFEYNPLIEVYENHSIGSKNEQAEYAEYDRLAKEYGYNAFETKINLLKLSGEIYFGDRKIVSSSENDLPVTVRTALVTLIYLDPALSVRGELGYGGANYYYYHCGAYFLELAANVIWIAASAWIGIACFKKRELH
ncbi:MAG: ABC transporter permease subunit [Clostridiales bacterium]|nr:ABC transporter permease subunit [Clostridiales bacterium]